MMNKYMVLCAVVGASFVGLGPREAHAGAWAQPAGQCYGKVWGTALLGSNAFGIGDEPGFETEPYTDFALNHYAECGVADQLSGQGERSLETESELEKAHRTP